MPVRSQPIILTGRCRLPAHTTSGPHDVCSDNKARQLQLTVTELRLTALTFHSTRIYREQEAYIFHHDLPGSSESTCCTTEELLLLWLLAGGHDARCDSI